MRRMFIVLIMTLLLLMLFPATSFADNPVIKDRFSADPAALAHDGKSITQTFLIETQPGIIPAQSTPLTLPTETVTEDTTTDTDTIVNNTSQPASESQVQDQSTTSWPFIVLGSLTILVISFYFRNKRHKA